ncbi:Ig-like domain-containing protein, partial [Microlunatus endophyticus]|uniref:Ig-like domain-containing protein n=1 Tax=Microlunatus endophyticus TaxID=1716077 RepID=UPI001E403510
TVNGDGSWTLNTPDPLADGDHTVSATQTDPAGNTSDADSVDFTVDATTQTPVITRPADGSSTRDTTPTISGTAEPGATVVVTDQDGTQLGTATTNSNGNWTFTSTALTPGGYTITATATDPSGNRSGRSHPDRFTIDTTAPAPPVITRPADGSTVTDNTPTIGGSGEPGATVTVSVDGDQIGTTTVNGDGGWTIGVAQPLGDGDHTVTATQTDPAGNTSGPSDPVDFTID